MKCTNGHDRCYLGPSENCPYCIKDQPRDERGRFIKTETKKPPCGRRLFAVVLDAYRCG